MLFPPKKAHWLEEGYFKKLHAAGKEEKEVCQLLITIGFTGWQTFDEGKNAD